MDGSPPTARVPAPRGVTLKPCAPPAPLLRAAMLAKQVLPHRQKLVTLYEDRIHIQEKTGEADDLPRRYTLTHSDCTAGIFLSIGPEYDGEALSRPQIRERRDDVLAELTGGDAPQLRVTRRVSADGRTGRSTDPVWRRSFDTEMQFVLAVIRYGDRFFFERHPDLDQAAISVEFRSSQAGPEEIREYGPVAAYGVNRIAGESRRLLFGAAAAAAALGVGAVILGKKRSR